MAPSHRVRIRRREDGRAGAFGREGAQPYAATGQLLWERAHSRMRPPANSCGSGPCPRFGRMAPSHRVWIRRRGKGSGMDLQALSVARGTAVCGHRPTPVGAGHARESGAWRPPTGYGFEVGKAGRQALSVIRRQSHMRPRRNSCGSGRGRLVHARDSGAWHCPTRVGIQS